MGSFPSANPSLPTSVPGVYVAESSIVPSPPATPTVIGFSTGTAANPTVVSKTLSAGAVQAGDLLLLAIDGSSTPQWFQPGAILGTLFTPLTPGNLPPAGGQGVTLAYRIATANEPASYSFSNANCTAVLLCIRGAGRISPVLVASGSSAAPPVFGIFAGTNSLVIGCLKYSMTNVVSLTTQPTSYTAICHDQQGSGAKTYLGSLTPAALGVVAEDTSAVLSGTDTWGSYTVAVSP